MIGLDTLVILRYLLQDDITQMSIANRIMERLSPEEPGFIKLATVLEIVWVMRSFLKLKPAQIAIQVEHLLAAETLQVQNEEQVFEAVFALKRGLGEFEHALIGALNKWQDALKLRPSIKAHQDTTAFVCFLSRQLSGAFQANRMTHEERAEGAGCKSLGVAPSTRCARYAG